MDFLEADGKGDQVIDDVVKSARKDNEEFRKDDLSSKELSDVSMQKFRVAAIAKMVPAATKTFVTVGGSAARGFGGCSLRAYPDSSCWCLCARVKEFDKRFGFRHRDVLSWSFKAIA